MRAVVQRVARASVAVEGTVVAQIGIGLVVLVAVEAGDDAADAETLVDKLSGLRVFPDEDGRMDRSLLDIAGEALVVSQFTLAADLRRGRRPSSPGRRIRQRRHPSSMRSLPVWCTGASPHRRVRSVR